MIQVLLGANEYDITNRVSKHFTKKEFRTLQRDGIIISNYKFTIENSDKVFSVNRDKSFFSNPDTIYNTPIKIKSNDVIVWQGIIKNVFEKPNDIAVDIETIDQFYDTIHQKVEYASGGYEGFGDIVKNVFDTYNINYNTGAMERSIALYDAASCEAEATITKDDSMDVMSFAEKMAEIGCADFFTHDGEVYFLAYGDTAGGITLEDKDFITFDSISLNEKDIINEYRIYHAAGGPEIDADNNNIGEASRNKYGTRELKEMKTGTEEIITLKDSTSAVYLGENYIKRSHILQNGLYSNIPLWVQFSLDIELDQYTTVLDRVTVNFTPNNINSEFQVMKKDVDYNSNTIRIEALQR